MRNNKGIAHENGAIESPHGHLKHRMKQALYLRGSFDFESVAAYQNFIDDSVEKLNRRVQTKFEEEQKSLQPLPKYRVPDYEVLTARVSRHSTIDVRCVLYTVPSRLIGRQIELHLYHNRVVGYLGKQVVVELPRVRVSSQGKRRARCINYRHVIEGLKRKPRAFIYCTWRDDLLPNDHYRRLWAQIEADFDIDSAAVLMVEALYIAATQNKAPAVAEYLETELSAGSLTLVGLRRHFQLLAGTTMPTVSVKQHNLSSYDQLLNSQRLVEPLQPAQDTQAHESLSKPQRASQKSPTFPYAQSLAESGEPSDARAVVVRSVLAGTLRIGGQPTLDFETQAQPQRSSVPRHQNAFQLRLDAYTQVQSRSPDAASN